MIWKVRVGNDEFEAHDVDVLKQWYRERRILPEHYVFHPVLEKWMYIKDLEEINPTSAPFHQQIVLPPPVPGTPSVSVQNIDGSWCPNCKNRNSYKTTSGIGIVWVVLLIVSCGLALIMIPFLPKTWHCRVCGNQWRA